MLPRRGLAAAALAATLALGACSVADLVNSSDLPPDTRDPNAVRTPAGALTAYNAAVTSLATTVQVVAPEGPVARLLVELADRDEDLLVVGECQRRGLRRLASRSVAKYCVRHAVCPVLIVPPPALARVARQDISREAQRFIDAR